MTTEAMRAQFEAWVTKQSWFIACLGLTMIHDAYIDPCVNSRWQGYQAALRSPAVAVLVEAATRLRSASHHSTEMGWIGDGDPWGQIDSALANFTGDKP